MQHTSYENIATAAPKNTQYELRVDPTPGTDNEVVLFGLDVSNTSMRQAVDWIIQRARQRQKTLLNFVNAHGLNTACRQPIYRRVLQRSDRLLPDGSGVKLALRLQGKVLTENLNGTDLFPHLCCAAAEHGLSIYLLGAGPGVAEQAAANMIRRFPQLRIAGTRDGYFRDEQHAEVIETINASGADVLLVAMGVPRQELWLAQHLDCLQTSINMGVGGLFDFYAERISRAPLWLRRLGMEWTWRLLQEPSRMWRRYVLGNPEFVLRALFDAAHIRRTKDLARTLSQGHIRAFGRRLHWWLSTRATPLSQRLLDITVAGSTLLIAAPLVAMAAIAIRVESPGSVLFSQQRVGLGGTPFRMWKFRSMRNDAEASKSALAQRNEMTGGVLFKLKRDPRITRVGRFIRRFSIDELPQLWNVLRGDMALVGPRPALPGEVAQYSLAARQRLAIRPGLTCIWQVCGRSNIPFEGQVAMDLEYIHKATLTTDLRLLLRTIPAVLSGDGAY
ncbi:MAG: exopolysaccharide biosynthesis WecB/TagA/CpsF family protein [Gammaproteobacteria bacterium]|jgi:exopolysaccharide biosynthesis WecB/TagA/CpsF family protein